MKIISPFFRLRAFRLATHAFTFYIDFLPASHIMIIEHGYHIVDGSSNGIRL